MLDTDLPERTDAEPVLRIRSASVRRGDRTLWSNLDLTVYPGEYIAILGANGAGKTTLLRAVLGEQPLSSGTLELTYGRSRIGYIPQHYAAADGAPIRAGDLISLAVDGNRFGLPLPNKRRRERVAATLAEVDASNLARIPVASLSGGQQQRIRIGQALASDPTLLLCDEPFGSLDLHQQKIAADLIDRRRRDRGTAVLLVTHDVNPVLETVDRVLYLAGGRFRIGTVSEVMRSEVLSELYGAPVEVVQVGGKLLVAGTGEDPHEHGRGPIS